VATVAIRNTGRFLPTDNSKLSVGQMAGVLMAAKSYRNRRRHDNQASIAYKASLVGGELKMVNYGFVDNQYISSPSEAAINIYKKPWVCFLANEESLNEFMSELGKESYASSLQ